MDLSTVTSINIGSTSVTSVYYLSLKIWPAYPDWFEQGDWIAFDVYITLNIDESDPGSATEELYEELLGFDRYKGYQHLYAVDGLTYEDVPYPYFTTTDKGNCVRYYVRKGIGSYIYMSDSDGDITFLDKAAISVAPGTTTSGTNSYMRELGWKFGGKGLGTMISDAHVYIESDFLKYPERYTISNHWSNNYAYVEYYHEDTLTSVRLCINKANKNTFPDSIMLNPAGIYGYYIVGEGSSNGISNIDNYSISKEWLDLNCDIVDNMYSLYVYPRANNYIGTGDTIFAMSILEGTPTITKVFPPSGGKLECTGEVINRYIKITNTGSLIPYGESSQGVLAVFQITIEGYSLGMLLTVNYNYAQGYTDAPAFSEWLQSTGNGTSTISDSLITITKFNSADASPVYFAADYTKLYYLCFNASGIPDDAQVYLDTYLSIGIYREYIKNGKNYLYLLSGTGNGNLGFRCSKALSSANIVITRLSE